MLGDVAAAFAFDAVHIHAAAVRVAHEGLAPVFLREVLAVVQHQAAVTVASTKIIRLAVSTFAPLA